MQPFRRHPGQARPRPSLLCAALAACLPLATQAQDASADGVESIVIQGSFLNSGAQSAMKLEAPVRDTPFSVSSYSDAFMKAIETTNVADMYGYMNGIKRAGTTGYDVVIRGMKAGGTDRNSMLVDGLPGLAGRFGSPPTIGIEHMEVVKGPMSVLYGQAQPGGFINLTTKKPKANASTEVQVKGTGTIGHGLSLADKNGYELAVDSTGPLTADKKFLYRLVADSVNRDLFNRANYERSMYVAPSVTWSIDDSTLLTAQIEYRKNTGGADSGIVIPNNELWRLQKIDITRRYQEAQDYRMEQATTASVQFEKTFANDMKWSAAARHVKNYDDTRSLGNLAMAANFTTLQRRISQSVNNRSYNFADTNLSIPLKTGSVEHKVLVGLNGGRDTTDFGRVQFFNRGNCPATALSPCFDIDIYNPVYGTVAPPASGATQFTNVAAGQHPSTASSTIGVYGSDLVTFSEHWKGTVGLRAAKEKQYFQEAVIPNTPSRTRTANSVLPMAGLLYQPTQQWTLYTSYSTSFTLGQPNDKDPFGNNNFKPEKAKQIEGGVKAENLWNGKATGTLSVFHIKKRDAVYGADCVVLTLTGCSQQVGAERSRGVELEMNIRPLETWQLSGGYAFTDAKVLESPVAVQVGAPLTNVARNSANFWSRYDFPSGALKGFGVGVGVTYTGARPGPLPSVPSTPTAPNSFMLPSYTLADLGLYYVRGRYSFNLKVGNVFDRTYYESSGFAGNVSVQAGQPRNVALSMRAMF